MRTRQAVAAMAVAMAFALLAGCAQNAGGAHGEGDGGISVSSRPGPPPEYSVVFGAAAREEARRDPVASAQKCWAALRPLIVADFRAGRLESEITGIIHIDFAPDPGNDVLTYQQVFQHVAALSRRDAELEPVWLSFLSEDVVDGDGQRTVHDPSARHARWIRNGQRRLPALVAEVEAEAGRSLSKADALDAIILKRVEQPERYGVDVDMAIVVGLQEVFEASGMKARWVTVRFANEDEDHLALEATMPPSDGRSLIYIHSSVAKRTQAGQNFYSQSFVDQIIAHHRAP